MLCGALIRGSGGKLVLAEVTGPFHTAAAFGLLEGWWLSRFPILAVAVTYLDWLRTTNADRLVRLRTLPCSWALRRPKMLA